MPVVVVVLQISPLLFYHCNTFHRQNDWADPVQEPLAEGMDMESSQMGPLRCRLEGALAQERPIRSAMPAGGESSAKPASAAIEMDILRWLPTLT